MAKKRVNISIDEELDKKWSEVAKKIGITKSAMVEEFLRDSLPILEDIDVKSIISHSAKTMGKVLTEYGEIIEELSEKKK